MSVYEVENGFAIRNIAPPDLTPMMASTYWGWVASIGLKVKDRELAQGLGVDGKPLRAISAYTRKHRKSAMTPSGRGDPTAPPLMPGRMLSRTRSLLTARGFDDHAEFWWRFDSWSGDSWARVLEIQRDRWGRDVIGLSPNGQRLLQAQAADLWRKYQRGRPIPAMPLPQPALAPPGPFAGPSPRAGRGRMPTLKEIVEKTSVRPRGGMTISELEAHYRAPAAPTKPGLKRGNVLLRHLFGEGQAPTAPPRPKPPKPKPPKPRPIITRRAAMAPLRPRRLLRSILDFFKGE